MKYDDLSSIVQLGVGLHVGTAVLQLYSDLGMAPMERRFTRMRELFGLPKHSCPSQELQEEFDQLEGRYALFKIEYFKRYRWFMGANSGVAVLLAVILTVIAFNADDTITRGLEWFVVGTIGLSFLPAPLMLGALWLDAWIRLDPLRKAADDLEVRAVSGT